MQLGKRAWSFGLAVAIATVAGNAFAQAGGAGGAPEVVDAGPPRGAIVVRPDIPIPQNGAILIQSDYGVIDMEEGMPIVEVRAEGTSATLGGSLREVQYSYWSWSATSPPAPGRYTVTVATALGAFDDSITVVDAIDLDQPLKPVGLHAELASPFAFQISTAYCVTVRDGVISQGGPLFPVTVLNQIDLISELSSPPELVHQFFYTASMVGSGPSQPNQTPDLWPRVGLYTEQSDQYCAVYEAISIATGARHATTLCAAHGELPMLGIHDVEVTDAQLERTVCLGPPAGLEQRWCALNRACDELGGADERCMMYGYVCRNECLPGGLPISSLGLPSGGNGEAPRVGEAQAIALSDAACVELEPDPTRDASALPSRDASALPSGMDAATNGDPMSRSGSSDGCGCTVIGGEPPAPSAWLWIALGSSLLGLARIRRSVPPSNHS